MDGKHALAAIVLVFLATLAMPASATTFSYGSFYGAVPGEVDFLDVKETTTTDPNALYGAPTRSDNWLWFFPPEFYSSSSNGLADTTSSQLSTTIVSDPNTYLSQIAIIEYGDYSLAGEGTSATMAKVSGALYITDMTPGHTPTVYPVTVTINPAGTFTLPPESDGIWSASASLDLTGYQISKVKFQLNNLLQTTSQSGTTSFIQKKITGGPAVGITAVPEPGSICLVIAGSLTLFRRRTRGH